MSLIHHRVASCFLCQVLYVTGLFSGERITLLYGSFAATKYDKAFFTTLYIRAFNITARRFARQCVQLLRLFFFKSFHMLYYCTVAVVAAQHIWIPPVLLFFAHVEISTLDLLCEGKYSGWRTSLLGHSLTFCVFLQKKWL